MQESNQKASVSQQLPLPHGLTADVEYDERQQASHTAPGHDPHHSRWVSHQSQEQDLENQTEHSSPPDIYDPEYQAGDDILGPENETGDTLPCSGEHTSTDILLPDALNSEEVQTQDEQGGCSQVSLPSLDCVKNESDQVSDGSHCELPDVGDTNLLHSTPAAKSKGRLRKGTLCKYELNTTTCWLCGKTLSTRKALIWHLYTRHNTKLPGTEPLIAGRLLTDKKRGIKKRQHLSVDVGLSEEGQGAQDRKGSSDWEHLPTASANGQKHSINIHKQGLRSASNVDSVGVYSLSEVKPFKDSVQIKAQRISAAYLSDRQKPEEGDTSDLSNSKDRLSKISHQRSRSREEGRLCEKCGEAFDDRKELLKHRRACQHSICHLCGKEVKFIKGHLRRRHHDLKRFTCPQCPKAFPTRWHLNHHLLLHSDERPYTCEVCGMSYRSKHHLTAHLRTHSGQKPYKCNQCQAAFTRSRGLKEHMRVHTGEKPYKCEVCGRQFSNSGNFAAHRRKVHKITPLPCPSEKYAAMREKQERPDRVDMQSSDVPF